MKKKLIVFLLANFLCSNIYSSETVQITHYTNNFMQKYVPHFLQSEPPIERLVQYIAYTTLIKSTLIKNFRKIVLGYCKQNIAELLGYGFEISGENLSHTICVSSPIADVKQIEECAVFILADSLWTKEEYTQYVEQTFSSFKQCLQENRKLILSKM